MSTSVICAATIAPLQAEPLQCSPNWFQPTENAWR